MADRYVKVLTPAKSFELCTLEEAKIMLGLSLSDSSNDTQIQMYTDINSALIMRLCNRIFAKERVQETWNELQSGRVYLSHWPVKEADIETISIGGSIFYNNGWMLEEASGKLSVGAGVGAVSVTYTGGYDLPSEAPLPLKRAVGYLNGKTRTEVQQAGSAAASGVRMIAHRDSRVMYHSPSQLAGKASASGTTTAAGAGIDATLNAILYHYMKIEV